MKSIDDACDVHLDLVLCENPQYVWRPMKGINKIYRANRVLKLKGGSVKQMRKQLKKERKKRFLDPINKEERAVEQEYLMVQELFKLPIAQREYFILSNDFKYIELDL